MELKYSDDVEAKRTLLRRACSLNLKPKVMKNLFAKWLEFEKRNNDHKKVNEVKALAAKYIEKCMSKLHEPNEDGEDEDDNAMDNEIEV